MGTNTSSSSPPLPPSTAVAVVVVRVADVMAVANVLEADVLPPPTDSRSACAVFAALVVELCSAMATLRGMAEVCRLLAGTTTGGDPDKEEVSSEAVTPAPRRCMSCFLR